MQATGRATGRRVSPATRLRLSRCSAPVERVDGPHLVLPEFSVRRPHALGCDVDLVRQADRGSPTRGRADAPDERTRERLISRQDVLDHSSCGPRRCPGDPHRHGGGVGILVGVDLELMSVALRGSRGLCPEQEVPIAAEAERSVIPRGYLGPLTVPTAVCDTMSRRFMRDSHWE